MIVILVYVYLEYCKLQKSQKEIESLGNTALEKHFPFLKKTFNIIYFSFLYS